MMLYWSICFMIFSGLLHTIECNFTCYSCLDPILPIECNEVQQCAEHEACYLDVYNSAAGLEYELGCRDTAYCGVGKRAVSVIGNEKRASSDRQMICSQCCSNALCNDMLCGQSGYPQLGPVCYHCSNKLSTDDCNTVQRCGRDKVCMLERVLSPNTHSWMYQSSCAEKSVCSKKLDNIRPQFGKRYSDQVMYGSSIQVKCCDNDLCNTEQGQSASTTPASG